MSWTVGRSQPRTGCLSISTFSATVPDWHHHLALFDTTQHAHPDGLPNPRFRQQAMQIVEVLDTLPIEGDDEVAVLKAGGESGAIRLERNDEHGRGLAEPMEARDPPQERHVLTGDAEVST